MIVLVVCNRSRKEWRKKMQNHKTMMINVIQNHFLHNSLFQRDPPTDLEESTCCSLFSERHQLQKKTTSRRSQKLHAEGILKVEKTEYHKQQLLETPPQRGNKVLLAEHASRLQHRYAVVVQDLTTPWISRVSMRKAKR